MNWSVIASVSEAIRAPVPVIASTCTCTTSASMMKSVHGESVQDESTTGG